MAAKVLVCSAKVQIKKPYSKPRLDRYGSFCNLTTATGSAKSNKDGGPNNTKTQ
jgi:hypothetical protein